MSSHTTPLQAHTIEHSGSAVTYYAAGRSAGITFVLVHGIGASAHCFMPLITALGETFRIIAIDLPGFGASSKPNGPVSIDDYAAVVQAVITKEGIMQPILLGHSMGCQVIANMLANDPRISAKAILIGPTVEAKKRDVFSYFRTLVIDGMHEPPRAHLLLWREYARCGPRQYFRTLNAMLRDRIEANLAASEAAIMIIRGSDDSIVPHAWAGKLAAITTVAGICEVRGAPHMVHITNTEEVADICAGFALA